MSRPTSITDILNKLQNVKPAGKDKWTADCPCGGHDTPGGHLSITDTGSKALVKCFSQHSFADICVALGFETLSYGNNEAPQRLTELCSYHYTGADGKPLYEVVRYIPKTFKVRRPDGSWGLGNVKPVLYHLQDIITANIYGDTVYICEGEKDADNAFLHFGTPSSTCPFGAGKWRPEYSEMLSGANVVVIPDNDKAGHEHCQLVCESLHGKAKSLKVWNVPAPFKDISDWLESLSNNDSLPDKVLSEAVPYQPGVKQPAWGVRL